MINKEVMITYKTEKLSGGKKISILHVLIKHCIDTGQLVSCISTLSFNSTGTFLLRLDKGEERQAELLLFCECYYCIFSFELWFHYSCVIFFFL